MLGIYYGWWIVIATSLIHFWGAGTFFYCFTAFFNPIVDEFGWSFAATGFAASLRSIEGGIASPIVGIVTDRYGPRRLILTGSILSGFGFLLYSQIQSLFSFYFCIIFLSVGSSLLFPIPGWTAVTNWFSRKRGTALGLLSSAVAFGGLLIYLVNWLIVIYGWRTALVCCGLGIWLLGIPCALIIRNNPEEHGLRPDGDPPLEISQNATGMEEPTISDDGYSLFEALKTKAFWLVAVISTISSAAIVGVSIHVMPFLISVNFSRSSASLVAGSLVIVSLAGRVGFGWLGDRVPKRYLMAIGLVLEGIGLLLLNWTRSMPDAVLFVLLFGPSYGAVITLRLTIQAEYFGRKAFGKIQGCLMGVIVTGTISSPVLLGWVYDVYHCYDPAWITMAVFVFATIPLALLAYPPPKQPAQ